MPTKIEATYRVVTPMFCGGADPERAELRLSSFKGVLRYWWRALAWAECEGNLKLIRKREEALFGSTGEGQSLVTMRLGEDTDYLKRVQKTKNSRSTTAPTLEGPRFGAGARYLGYGIAHTGKLSRRYVHAPFEFEVRMRVRNPTGRGNKFDPVNPDLLLLQDALIVMGVFGGMGAKSRKGYGSLVLRSLTVDGGRRWDAPRSESDLEDRIERLLRRRNGNEALPKYTAFSAKSRYVLVSSGSNQPLELLNLIGRELVRYRSWGRNGRILKGKEESERNFPHDHDLMKRKGGRPNKHPCRIAFGLPHNYGRDQIYQVVPAHFDRRASPLFIHIHECDGKPVAVLSFLPAQFLPEPRSAAILVGRRKVTQQPEKKLYRPIHDFLDRLLDPGKRKEKKIERVIEIKVKP